MTGGDLLILIPMYQAEGSIGAVVHGALRSGCEVVAIDDGSTDRSGAEAEAAGALVLRHASNHGKGAALQTGFAFAERRRAQAVLTLDADGQHDPAEIPRLCAAHREHPDALVIGVRRFNEEMPRRSRIGNSISTYWIARFAHQPYSDSQSGFRIYPRTIYAGAAFRSSRFDTETELLLRAAKLKVPLVEVAVKTIYPREEAHRTHFHSAMDTWRIIRLVIGSPWWRLPR